MVKELGKSLSNKYIYICIYVYVFEPRITKPEPSNLLFSRTCFFFMTVLSRGDFFYGKFGVFCPGKASCNSCAIQPTVHAGCFTVSVIHQTLDTDYSIFNMHTGVNVSDCTGGCTDYIREPALKVDSGRKIPCRTGESNLNEWPANLTLYHLSYLPAFKGTRPPKAGPRTLC